jgi:spore coat protein CotH
MLNGLLPCASNILMSHAPFMLVLALIVSCTMSRSSETITGIELSIARSDIKKLAENPKRAVPVVVRWDGTRVTNAVVHLKGTGSFRPISDKPSFSIRSPVTNLFGRKKLLLNNSAQDASFLKWKIASELFRRAGVPAAEVSFARVTLNGVRLGLYLNVEPTDKKFLRKYFDDASGNLYEGDNQDVTDVLDQDNGDTDQSQSDRQRLASACLEEDLPKRWTALNDVLDVDRFLTFMAVEVLVDHRDGYSMDRNNFRLYHNPADHRFVFLPHGLDLLFYSTELSPSRSFSSVLARGILETPQGHAAYESRFKRLAQEFYADEKLIERIDQLWAIIKRDAPAESKNAVDELRSVIRGKIRIVRAQR